MSQSRKSKQQEVIRRAETAGENLVAVGSSEYFDLGHTLTIKISPAQPPEVENEPEPNT